MDVSEKDDRNDGPSMRLLCAGAGLALAAHAQDTFRFEHTCVHDAVIAKAPPPTRVPQRPAASRRRSLQDVPPAGLRISFDMETLPADERACTSVGQVVDIGRSGGPSCSRQVADDCQYTCTARDILSPADVDLLSSLLPAVAAWYDAALEFREYIPRPDRLTVDTRASCGFGGAVPIPAHLGAPGLAETDVAILVTARCSRLQQGRWWGLAHRRFPLFPRVVETCGRRAREARGPHHILFWGFRQGGCNPLSPTHPSFCFRLPRNPSVHPPPPFSFRLPADR